MQTAIFYNGRTRAEQADLSLSLIDSDFSVSTQGSIEGELIFEILSTNKAFIDTLKENSHYIKFSIDSYKKYGAVVSDCVIDSGVARVSIIGWDQYTDKFEMYSSFKANSLSSNTLITESDESHIKTFYSDSQIGLLYGLFSNLQETVIARGYSSFFDFTPLESKIENNNGTTAWSRSYRLNSLEFPTVKSVIDNVLNDSDLITLKVEVDDASTLFQWKIDIITSYTLYELDERVNDIADLEIEKAENISRSFSFASGTNLSDEDIVSKIDMDNSVAYSSHIVNEPTDRSEAISRINSNSIKDESKKLGQVTFKTFNTQIGILDAVVISRTHGDPIRAIINGITVNGTEVEYTGQIVTDSSNIIAKIDKPSNIVKRKIINNLDYAKDTSRKNAFKKPSSTGVRS